QDSLAEESEPLPVVVILVDLRTVVQVRLVDQVDRDLSDPSDLKSGFVSRVAQPDRESCDLLVGAPDRPIPWQDDPHIVAEGFQGLRQTAGHIAQTAHLGEGIRLGRREENLHRNLGVDRRPLLKPASGAPLSSRLPPGRSDPFGHGRAFAKGFSLDVHAEAVPPTPLGHLVFVLHTHLPWVLGHGRWPHGQACLYEATAECYLPILRLLDRLEEEGRKGSITIGITPVLSEMLATPRFREGFLAYLEERTNRAEADQREFDAAGDDGRRRAAAAWS